MPHVLPSRLAAAALALLGAGGGGARGLAAEEAGCPVSGDPAWSATEAWAFERVCGGDAVDMRFAPEGASTALSGAFVEAILLHEPWRSAVPPAGVRILGAEVPAGLELGFAEVSRPLHLTASRIGGPVRLDGASLAAFGLAECEVRGALSLEGTTVRQGLDLRQATAAGGVLSGARIGHAVDLRGARIDGRLDLRGIRVDSELRLDGGGAFGEVLLSGAWIGGRVSLGGSTFSGDLLADGLLADGALVADRTTSFAAVDLSGARVQGDLALSGVSASGRLDLTRAEVAGDLMITPGAALADVILRSARVRGMVALDGARLSGGLDLRGAEIEGHLRLAETAIAAWVDLSRVRVSGDADLDRAKLGGPLSGDALVVEGSLGMTGATFGDLAALRGAGVARGVDLAGSRFERGLDLSGTSVGGELAVDRPGGTTTSWGPEARLVLRDATAGALADTSAAWPRAGFDLDGFRYERLGSALEPDPNDLAFRDAAWFEHWLTLQRPFSPGPWEEVAFALESQGFPDKARALRYAARERSRSALADRGEWGRYAAATMLAAFVGHGHRLERAVFWALAALLLGAFLFLAAGRYRDVSNPPSEWGRVARFRGEVRRHLGRAVLESADELVPVLSLRRGEDVPAFGGWLRGYVYVHRLFGLVLLVLVVAALLGWIG